jgi:DNA-directed RNA polymerase specialized sigma24 family protein
MSGGQHFYVSMDPSELEARFASPAPDEDPEPVQEDDDPFAGMSYTADVVPLLDDIPPFEADLIELYYGLRKKQCDIAEIFGPLTQAAVSYRLERAIERLKFIRHMKQTWDGTAQDMRRDLSPAFPEIDVEILVGMWETTCQSEVAKRLHLTQGRVRHRYFKARDKLPSMADRDPTLLPYSKLFGLIDRSGFNMKHVVVLPQWANRQAKAAS